MQGYLTGVTEGTGVLLALSIILFAGFIMTRLTNTLNLPKVSGYILAGILIGPCGLNMIPEDLIGHMGFVSDLALAFIAFGVGKFFKKEVIRQTGPRIIVITMFEALMAGFLVTVCAIAFFHLDLDFALILGAIATATAPASTMMTINQYKAKGEFVNVLLQIVALDDVVCLMAFSIVAAVASRDVSEAFALSDVMMPIIYNILALGLGFFCGYFLSRLLIPTRSRDNRLILAIAMLLGISGICAALDISPLLACMVFGAAYINLTRDKKLYRQINNFTPPVMSIFFIVSGMNLDLTALQTVGAIGVAYFVIRIIGKYLGTYISCWLTGTSKAIRNYMGLALIPQAGVAIGLAFLGQRLLPPEKGNLLLTIILSSSVLYEMVGPISAKVALFMSGCITTEKMKQIDEEIVLENQGLLPAEVSADAKSKTESRTKAESAGKSDIYGKTDSSGRLDTFGKQDSSGKKEAVKKPELAGDMLLTENSLLKGEVYDRRGVEEDTGSVGGEDCLSDSDNDMEACEADIHIFEEDDSHELEDSDILDVESPRFEHVLLAGEEAGEDEDAPEEQDDDDESEDSSKKQDGTKKGKRKKKNRKKR